VCYNLSNPYRRSQCVTIRDAGYNTKGCVRLRVYDEPFTSGYAKEEGEEDDY
jgi:hypothetical protein